MLKLEQKYYHIIKSILGKYPYSFYAFGSRIKGTEKKFSDLDLCFVENIPFNIQAHIDEDFEESDLPFKVDIIDFVNTNSKFKAMISKDLTMIQASEDFLKIEKNLFGKFCDLPAKLGFKVERIDNTAIVKAGLGSSMFNIVCDSKLDENNIKLAIESIIKNFSGQPFAWWVGPSSTPNSLGKYLEETGLIKETTEYAMLCGLEKNKIIYDNHPDLIIRQVKEVEEIKHVIEILKPYDPTSKNFYDKLVEIGIKEEDNTKLFVGYYNNIPVIIGSLFFNEEIVGIFDLITLENMRGKGFGTNMMKFLMQYAANKGYTQVSLSASSDSGYRIYEHLGFKTVGIFECFEWKPQ